jgi:hypothetical protein
MRLHKSMNDQVSRTHRVRLCHQQPKSLPGVKRTPLFAQLRYANAPCGIGCPLCAVHSPMSALGQKQTYAVQKAMSALHPIATAKADISIDRAGCRQRERASHPRSFPSKELPIQGASHPRSFPSPLSIRASSFALMARPSKGVSPDDTRPNAPAALINKSLAEANKPGFQQTSKPVRWRPCLE